MPYLILGIAVLLGFWLAGRWFVSVPPATAVKGLKWTFLVLAILLVAFVAFSKQFNWLAFAIPFLLPWFMRARSLARMAKNWQRMSRGAQAGPGQTSEVETRFLRMWLDHNSGQMDGEVVSGSFAGKTLSGLSLDDLLDLMGEASEDDQSVQILAAFLERQFPDSWRDRAQERGANAGGNAPNAGGGTMSREEALEILGVEEGATKEEIKKAHHGLMGKVHPDRGGSTYLASKINQAKDLLLGE